MRWIILVCCLAVPVHAQIRNSRLERNQVVFTLADGSARIEWLTAAAFRFHRRWDNAPAPKSQASDAISVNVDETPEAFTVGTKYVRVRIAKADARLAVFDTDQKRIFEDEAPVARSGGRVTFAEHASDGEKFFGLGALAAPSMNLRGQRLPVKGMFLSSAGYGIDFPRLAGVTADLTHADRFTVEAPDLPGAEFVFYLGPSFKEIYEQRRQSFSPPGLSPAALDPIDPRHPPQQVGPTLDAPVLNWDGLRSFVRALTATSVSALLYPLVDTSAARLSPSDVRSRAEQLAALLPFVTPPATPSMEWKRTRERWKPYLITYLNEAFDRGFPLIHSFPMQFPKDAAAAQHLDEFLLGDEVLLLPVIAPGARRPIDLPQGNWTDLRTNRQYRGRTHAEIDLVPGEIPILARNGSILPLATGNGPMELHYFPDLAAEFFLYEPELDANSQMHAAPAVEYLRLEIESQVSRHYQWIVHHGRKPRAVMSGDVAYPPVLRRDKLAPGTWFYDAARGDLHVFVASKAGGDEIVSISF